MGRPSRTAAVKARSSVSSAYRLNPLEGLENDPERQDSDQDQAGPSTSPKGNTRAGKRKAGQDWQEENDSDSQDEFRMDESGSGKFGGAGEEDAASSVMIDEDEDEEEEDEPFEEDEMPSTSKKPSKSRSNKGSKSSAGAGNGAATASSRKSRGAENSVNPKSSDQAPTRGGGGPLNRIDNSRIKSIKTSGRSSKHDSSPTFYSAAPTFNPSYPSNYSIQPKSRFEGLPKNFLKVTHSKNQWPQSDDQPDLRYSDPNEEDFINETLQDLKDVKEGRESLNDICLNFIASANLFDLDQVRDIGWYPGKVDVPTQMKWTEELDSEIRSNAMDQDQADEDEESEDEVEGSTKILAGMPLKGKSLRYKPHDLNILSPSEATPYVEPAPVATSAPKPAPNLHVPSQETSASEHPDSDSNFFLEPNPSLSGESLKMLLGPMGLQTEVAIRRGQGLRFDSISFPTFTSQEDEMEIDSGNKESQSSEAAENRSAKVDWWKKSRKGSHLLNVGGLVYDLDFRPLPPHLNKGSEFLAVSSGNSKNDPFPRISFGTRLEDLTPDSIQIWEIQSDFQNRDTEKVGDQSQSGKKNPSSKASKKGTAKQVQNPVEDDQDQSSGNRTGKAKEVLRICTDFGKAIKVRWFPNGHDYLSEPRDLEDLSQMKSLRRLGILAAIFLDGTARIFSVPHPDDLRSSIEASSSKSKSQAQSKAQARNDQHEDERPMCIKLDPILTLNVPTKVPSCLAWGGERLAVAYADGWISIWDFARLMDDVKNLNREQLKQVRSKPSHLFQAHDSTILSIDFVRNPSLQVGQMASQDDDRDDDQTEVLGGTGKTPSKSKTKGQEKEKVKAKSKKVKDEDSRNFREEVDHFSNPNLLTASGVDGRCTLIDLRDPNCPFSASTFRDFTFSSVYYPTFQTPVKDDPDGSVQAVLTRMGYLGQQSQLSFCTGRILNLAASDFHPFIASATSDGSVTVMNGFRNVFKKLMKNRLSHPVYRLEMNRDNGQLRMLDNMNPVPAGFFMPTEAETSKSNSNHPHKGGPHGYSAGGWHPSISIRCLKWSPNIGRSLLLASGSGCGLVRIDWVDNKGAPVEPDPEAGKLWFKRIIAENERLKEVERGYKAKATSKGRKGKGDGSDEDMDELEAEN